MQYFSTILLGILVTTIGALPFGLVNLSVLDASYRKGRNNAMRIAHGAAWIEILFVLTAILAGSFILQFTKSNQILNYTIVAILVFAGLVFILKRNKAQSNSSISFSGFFKGVFLNLISIQVFIFWLMAIAFLFTRQLLQVNIVSILFFTIGVWIGKMGVLWIYAYLSQKILSKSIMLSKNINRIIGSILIITAFVQVFKF